MSAINFLAPDARYFHSPKDPCRSILADISTATFKPQDLSITCEDQAIASKSHLPGCRDALNSLLVFHPTTHKDVQTGTSQRKETHQSHYKIFLFVSFLLLCNDTATVQSNRNSSAVGGRIHFIPCVMTSQLTKRYGRELLIT